jgi:cytochrome c
MRKLRCTVRCRDVDQLRGAVGATVLQFVEPAMTVNPTRFCAAFMAFLLVGLSHPGSSAQITGSPNPRLVISSMYGPDLFQFYCSACHGRDGKGGGPVAPNLKVAPADLTTLALHRGGVFPKARVEALVTGGGDPPAVAHGSKEMPVWGPIFQALDPSDAMNRIRIANIVEYLESIQQAR